MLAPARKMILGLVLAASLVLGVSSAQAANLVPNPGFEAACGSVPCNWTAILSTIARDTVNPHSGSASLAAMSTGQQVFGARSDCFSISASTAYSESGWYRTTSPNPVGITLHLFEYSDAGCGAFVGVSPPRQRL